MIIQNITAENLSSNGIFILDHISAQYAYDSEGKPTKAVIGCRVACRALPTFESITVKMPIAPEDISLSNEDIETANSEASFILIRFQDMVIKPYFRDGEQRLSCTATSFTLLNKRKDG